MVHVERNEQLDVVYGQQRVDPWSSSHQNVAECDDADQTRHCTRNMPPTKILESGIRRL